MVAGPGLEPELCPPSGLRGLPPPGRRTSRLGPVHLLSLPFDSEETDAHPSLRSELYLLPDPGVLPGGPASGSFLPLVGAGVRVLSGRVVSDLPADTFPFEADKNLNLQRACCSVRT